MRRGGTVSAGAISTALLSLILVACAGGTGTTGGILQIPEDDSAIEAVGRVSADPVPPGFSAPDLAIAVFDQGLDGVEPSEAVFPTVRKAESLLLPVTLADALRESGAFPVVRVVHEPDVFLPLVLTGEILRSDGAVLELRVALRGADGRELFEGAYRDEADPAAYRDIDAGTAPADTIDPFSDLYLAISNDLVAALAALPEERRQELDRLARIRFGAALAPDSFARYLDEAADGTHSLAGFPADDDPMLARLDRLRRQDELFIDTVDQQYRELRDAVGASYALWRAYGFELDSYGERYRESAAERRSDARRGTFASMQQVYATYRKVKLQEEDFRDLVAGFTGESLETVLSVDDGVYRLSGSVADRYAEWQRILEQIFSLEIGLPPLQESREPLR